MEKKYDLVVIGCGPAGEKAATKAEIEAVSLSPDILTKRIAEPWQRELLGVVKDPTYTFHATTSRQARLAFGLKYTNLPSIFENFPRYSKPFFKTSLSKSVCANKVHVIKIMIIHLCTQSPSNKITLN